MITVAAGAALLALVHLFAGKLRFLDVIPRSRWLSFASGASVAYVFIHLLPEISEAQLAIRRAFGSDMRVVENPAFVLAAAGLATFYGLERLAERSRQEERRALREDSTSMGVFWLHIVSFAIYNVLIGYVLAERSDDLSGYLLFLLAMAVHFVVNDFGLRQHHKDPYQRKGRWILAVAVGLGALVGCLRDVPQMFLLLPLSFIAGGVTLNVLKEELPRERESRFWAFALGMALYGAVLISA